LPSKMGLNPSSSPARRWLDTMSVKRKDIVEEISTFIE
jgi:hypothetical protein